MSIGTLAQKLWDSVTQKTNREVLRKIKEQVHPAVNSLYKGDEVSSGEFTITHSNEDITVHIENNDSGVFARAENESKDIQSRDWGSVDETVDGVSESAVLSVLDVVLKKKN